MRYRFPAPVIPPTGPDGRAGGGGVYGVWISPPARVERVGGRGGPSATIWIAAGLAGVALRARAAGLLLVAGEI